MDFSGRQLVQSLIRRIGEPLTGRRERGARRQTTVWRDGKPASFGPVALISQDPPIFMTGVAFAEWIGVADAFGRRFGDMPAGFLLYPTWSIEEPEAVAAIGCAARAHQHRYPAHRLVFMCNTQREAELLVGEGLRSIFLNKNFIVSETIFRPLPDRRAEFDAIYNARFIPEKRHELAAAIDRAGYISFIPDVALARQEQRARMERLLGENPRHVLLNPVDDGQPVWLDRVETNRQLNRAPVGLCLSQVEGANYASMEYMLAGLGVVSTPSTGGRDVYFDPEFCIVCDPDPEAVRDAVEDLKARNISSEHIRQATLARVVAARCRFLELIEDLRRDLGGRSRRTPSWTFAGVILWETFDAHLDEFQRSSKVGFRGWRA